MMTYARQFGVALLGHRRIRPSVSKALLLALLLSAAGAHAQSTSGSIAGVVRDASGAVLPGVTVEAASPALIEKVRTVVTDGQGNYKIVDLRPGTYAVTFTLPGFGTVKREGVELTTGFTATINADMKVGAVEETVIVTGASPIVDVQNTRTQNVLSREQLDVLPTAKTMASMAALTLGATTGQHDVGGANGEGFASIAIHGTSAGDHQQYLDGFSYQMGTRNAGGSSKNYSPNQWITQEVTLETAGMNAESDTAGIQVNFVPKDGGNTFHGVASGNYAGEKLQGDNLDDALRARGVTATPSIRTIYDSGGGFGGPIVRDRFWFYGAGRKWQSSSYQAGTFFNATQHTPVYTADLNRRAFKTETGHNEAARLTWQATSKQKVGIFANYHQSCICLNYVGLSAPEATWGSDLNNKLLHGTWTYAPNNKLLLQAGSGFQRNPHHYFHQAGSNASDVPLWDFGTGLKYNAYITSPTSLFIIDYGRVRGDTQMNRASMSYVTGSHAFKVGIQTLAGFNPIDIELNEVAGLGPVAYLLFNGRPIQVAFYTSPHHSEQKGFRTGTFVQDQWTLQRLTLNLGLRFDYNKQWVPEQDLPGGAFYPATQFPAMDVVSWKDINPRVGAAFDIFGTGRTAIKGAIGRYVTSDLMYQANLANPANSMVTGATRTWNDANNDFFPQAGELGPLSNAAFGTVVQNVRFDPDILNGWHVRPYLWQGSASINHELRPGLGVQGSYFRTWYGNFRAADNTLVTPADFDPFCITTPSDARLPGGGGQRVCGFSDVRPALFGRASYLVTAAETFGEPSQVYNGVEVSLNAKFGRGGLLTGGVSSSRTETDVCYVIDSPQQLYQCNQVRSWSAETQFKLAGSYPLPWGLGLSGVFQLLPGAPVSAAFTATNAQIAPSLGRNLAACGAAASCTATVTLPPSGAGDDPTSNFGALGRGAGIIEPFTQFEKRLTQLDLRVQRRFQFGAVRVQPQLDIYNIFNANTILSQNTTYGAAWLRPTQILPARFVKFGAQIDF